VADLAWVVVLKWMEEWIGRVGEGGISLASSSEAVKGSSPPVFVYGGSVRTEESICEELRR